MKDDKRLDPETLKMLSRVFDEAWVRAQYLISVNGNEATSIRSELAKRLLAAAHAGERDPTRLKLIALKDLDAGLTQRYAARSFVRPK
jgi:hypothetical protein